MRRVAIRQSRTESFVTTFAEHVSVSFAKSGGPGGQNVNKVNTKVDMRFNVKNATWISERIRDKILLMEKNRMNKNGEIVISSTRTRTQQGNIQDCLSKLQVILDAASYVPPPPSEEQKKKIVQLIRSAECNTPSKVFITSSGSLTRISLVVVAAEMASMLAEQERLSGTMHMWAAARVRLMLHENVLHSTNNKGLLLFRISEAVKGAAVRALDERMVGRAKSPHDQGHYQVPFSTTGRQTCYVVGAY
ncbi:hypothetical protein KSS87_015659 [Heliosperma pusillum]|nr:hypothetical protein KSS87_015659 [Heliosperma pusillum]